MALPIQLGQAGQRPGRLRCPTDAEWAEWASIFGEGIKNLGCEHLAIDRNGVAWRTPDGFWWFPISDSEHTALPQAGVAGVPLGDLLGVLETGGVGRRFVDQLPELVRSGQLEGVVKAQQAARSKGGFFDDFLSVALPFVASVGGNLIAPGLGTILGPVTSAALNLGGIQGSSTAAAITPLLTSVGASVSTPGTPLNTLVTNLLTSVGLAAPAPPPIPVSVGLPPAPAPALPAAAPTGLGAVLQGIFGPGVSADLGGIATLGAQLLQLAGTFAPDIVKALQGWDKTHSKHIPAGLAGLLLLMGKFAQRPTARDRGLILNIGDLKQGLSSLGVRFSPDEELDDVVMMEPLGNVVATGFEELGDQVAREIGRAVEAAASSGAELAVTSGQAITQGLGTGFEELARAGNAQKGILEELRDALQKLLEGLAGAITKGLLPEAQRVVDFLAPLIEPVVTVLAESITAFARIAHGPISAALTPTFSEQLRVMLDAILTGGEVRPEDAPGVAGRVFDQALTVGIVAHALSAAVELVHPTHHLGLSQLAAGFADAAAFGPIAAASVANATRIAVGRPTTWLTNKQTRTNLPDLRDVVDAYSRGFLTWDNVVERMEFEGIPERWIGPFEQVPFRRPAGRELGVIFEDAEIDEAWITRMLREQGYRPEDADKVLEGVRLRSSKSYRQGLLSEAEGAYGEGWIGTEDLDTVLETLRLRPETRRLIHQRAAIGRLRFVGKLALGQYRTVAEAQAMELVDFRSSLVNLGLDPQVVDAETAAVEGRIFARTHRDERAEIKHETRQTQEELTRVLQEQVRRGIVTPEGMEVQLVQAGVQQLPARLAAVLAGLRTLPVPRPPEVLSVQAAEDRVRQIQTAQVMELVRKDQVPPTAAVLALMQIGVPAAEAQARVELAVAQSLKHPEMPKPPVESPQVREARRILSQEALAAYRAGEISEGALRTRLAAAGQPHDVVDALVSRAVTEARIAAERDVARVAALVQTAALKAAARAA